MGNQQMAYSSNHQPPPVEDSNEWYDSVTDVEDQKQHVNNPENSVVVNGILDEFIDSLLESKIASSPSEALTSQYLPDDQQRNQTRPNTYGEVALNWKGVDIPPEPDRPDDAPSHTKSCDPPSPSSNIPRKDEDVPTENEIKFLTNIRDTLQDTTNETFNKEGKFYEESESLRTQQAISGGVGSKKELCLKSDSVAPLPCPEDCEILRESSLNENIKAFELSPKDVRTINQSGKFCKVASDPDEIGSLHLPSKTIEKSINDKFDEDATQGEADIEALNTSTIIRAGEEMLEKTTSYLEYIARQELKEGSKKGRSKAFTEALKSAELDKFLDMRRSTSLQSQEIRKADKQKYRKDVLIDSAVIDKLKKDVSEEKNIVPSCSTNRPQETPQKSTSSIDRTSDEFKVPPMVKFKHSQKKNSMKDTRNAIRPTTREGKSDINSKKKDTIITPEVGSPDISGGLEESPNCRASVLTTPTDVNNENTLLEESRQERCSIVESYDSSLCPADEISSCNVKRVPTTELNGRVQENTVSKGSQKKEDNLRELIALSGKQQTKQTSPVAIDPAAKDENICIASKPSVNLNSKENGNRSATSSLADTASNISSGKLADDSNSSPVCESSVSQLVIQDSNTEPVVSATSSDVSITSSNEVLRDFTVSEGNQQNECDSKESATTCERLETSEQSSLETAGDALKDKGLNTKNDVNRNVIILSSSPPTDIDMVEESHYSSICESGLSNPLNQNPDAESLVGNVVETVCRSNVDDILPGNEVPDCKVDSAHAITPTDFNHATTVSKESNEETQKPDSPNPSPAEAKDPFTARQELTEGKTRDVPKALVETGNGETGALPNYLGNCTMALDVKEKFCYVGGMFEHSQKEGAGAELIKTNDSAKELMSTSSSVTDFTPPSSKPEDALTNISYTEKPSNLEEETEKNLESKLCDIISTSVDNPLCVMAPTVKDETSSVDNNDIAQSITQVDSSSCVTDFVQPSKKPKDALNNTTHSDKSSDPEEESDKNLGSKWCDNTNAAADDPLCVIAPMVKDKMPPADNESVLAQTHADKPTSKCTEMDKSLDKEAENHCQNETKDEKVGETCSQGDINETAPNVVVHCGSTHKALLPTSLNKQKQKNIPSPRKSSIDAITVKQKSFSPEAENHEVNHSDKPVKEEFSDALTHFPEEDKKPPRVSSTIPQLDIATSGTPVAKRGKIRPFAKEQTDYRQHKEARRKSTATCSENIPAPKESIKAFRGSIDASALPEATVSNSLYKEGNICDLDEVINQFRQKQKSTTTENAESHLKLEGKAALSSKLSTKKSISDTTRNSAKDTVVNDFCQSVEYNKEKKVSGAGNKNAENISMSFSKSECETSVESFHNEVREQSLPKDDVNFRGVAGEQKVDSVGSEEKDVPKEKSEVAGRVTETTNNSSPSMETKSERMPELKPETLKSLIADLSLSKSTADVGCNTEEDWTTKDNTKKEAEWMKERKKLIGRIAELHQTQNATKFIVKELIFLVKSWMEGKDRHNVDLQETRQKLIDERDQALEDLRSVEESFYELHRRYEKIKKLIEDYKKNEEMLKRQIADGEEKLRQHKQMFDHLVKHSENKLEQANAEILNIGKTKESELAVLTAQLRKAEMKATSLEKALEQKVRENTELSSICEDLINKCGKK